MSPALVFHGITVVSLTSSGDFHVIYAFIVKVFNYIQSASNICFNFFIKKLQTINLLHKGIPRHLWRGNEGEGYLCSMLTTEQPSNYRHLEQMPVGEIIKHINDEDKTVALAVEKALPQIEKLIIAVTDKMLTGGKLFYIGAGTSGRLGILDASECPPTYGIPYDLVQGIIAGGFNAIIKAAEFAEDDTEQGWLDLQSKKITDKDFVIGIAASGTTPYVIGALLHCKQNNIATGCITCNANTPLAKCADYSIEVITGSEFVTGSTRMKAGTAQKMVLNMISTTLMIQLGRVEDNRMVNMQLSNEKLIDRGVKMLMQQSKLTDYTKSKEILMQYGSVKKAMESIKKT